MPLLKKRLCWKWMDRRNKQESFIILRKTEMQDTRYIDYKTWSTSWSLTGYQSCSNPIRVQDEAQLRSVPELDLTVPAAGDHLRRLVRMPERADAHLIMRLDPMIELRRLPVPDIQLPVGVAGDHVTVERETVTDINQEAENTQKHDIMLYICRNKYCCGHMIHHDSSFLFTYMNEAFI